MAAPIEVRSETGALEFDIDSRLYRRLTFVNTGTNDGSIVVGDIMQGRLVAAQVSSAPSGVTPVVTNTGSTINWTFNGAPAGDRRDVTLAIGVY